MRLRHVFPLLLLLPSVTPLAVVTIWTLFNKFVGTTSDIWQIYEQVDDLVNHKSNNKAFDKLDDIQMKISEISTAIQSIGTDLNTILQELQNLPGAIEVELVLKDFRTMKRYLDSRYKDMEEYLMYPREYEKSTLLDFANNVVSHNINSVRSMVNILTEQILRDEFINQLLERYKPKTKGLFCKQRRSTQQLLLDILSQIYLYNVKSAHMQKSAYAIKKMYQQLNFTKETANVFDEFSQFHYSFINRIIPYVAKSSLEIWTCDPDRHQENTTYVEITNFLHGYILNKINLDHNGQCRDECDSFTYVKPPKCDDNKWCNQEVPCPKVVNCKYVDSSMDVCSSSLSGSHRRYEYVKFANGQTYGRRNACSKKSHLETFLFWIIYKCSYCFCICDEGPKYYSNRFISLRLSNSEIAYNKVVTGLRFVKINEIVHLQVQQGSLLPYGQIDGTTINWAPISNFSVLDEGVYNGTDYHILSWEERGFDLDDYIAKPGNVVTGVQFYKVGSRLHLKVETTPFNFTTGKLIKSHSEFLDDDSITLNFKHKINRELKLKEPDLPTRKATTAITSKKFVQFTHSGFEEDAAQTTVPFFDAQEVSSKVPVPLSGLGVIHKGAAGSGGFIAPRIFAYNFTEHLEKLKS